jgi:short-subunit dehydrogenase
VVRPDSAARQWRSIGLTKLYRLSDASGYVGLMRAPFNWTDSAVVVTGGSRGIGLAIAGEALSRGARVGLISRSATDLERAESWLRDTHAVTDTRAVSDRVITAVADVAVRSELEAALDEIAAGLGPVDVLVNNAGTGAYGKFVGGDLDALERALRVNFLGTVYGTRAVLPGMLERRRGHVVNISSVAGRVATPGESAYSASKFAVVGFTQCVAIELRDSTVGISMILPGPVDTSRHFGDDGRSGGSFPPTVPAERVARATLNAVDKRQEEVVVPP